MLDIIAPTRSPWRASAGWDTTKDGWMRGGVLDRAQAGVLWLRQLRPGCTIPIECGETRTLASVLRVTTHAAGSDCLNCHGPRKGTIASELRSAASKPSPWCDYSAAHCWTKLLDQAACSAGRHMRLSSLAAPRGLGF
jgi:hypothetical protein